MLVETETQKTNDNKIGTWYNFMTLVSEISLPDLLWSDLNSRFVEKR
jgi:hypothetical protein